MNQPPPTYQGHFLWDTDATSACDGWHQQSYDNRLVLVGHYPARCAQVYTGVQGKLSDWQIYHIHSHDVGEGTVGPVNLQAFL